MGLDDDRRLPSFNFFLVFFIHIKLSIRYVGAKLMIHLDRCFGDMLNVSLKEWLLKM